MAGSYLVLPLPLLYCCLSTGLLGAGRNHQRDSGPGHGLDQRGRSGCHGDRHQSARPGLKRTAKTDDAGRFNFPQLKPGAYTVRAEAQGFEPQQAENVVLRAGSEADRQPHAASGAIEADGRRQCGSADHQYQQPKHIHDAECPALENLPNPGGDMTYPVAVRAGSPDQHRGQRQRFCRQQQRIRQRGIQWSARALQWLHRRWAGDQRSAHQSQ